MKGQDMLEFTLLAALWGGSFLFMRAAAPEFGAIPLIEMRTAIAAMVLLPILLVAKKGRALVEHWRALFVLGVVGTALPFSLLAYTTLYVTAGYASILNATVPMFGALVTYCWLKERLSGGAFIGLLVGFSGVFVLVLDKGSRDAELNILPVLAALTATLLYGIGATFTKVRFGQVAPLALAAGCQLASAVFLLPAALYLWPSHSPSTMAWVNVVMLGVACTGIAYILFFRLISHIGPSKTLTVTYVIPVFGVFWGWLFLDEAITENMLIGGAFILVGVGLTTGLFTVRRRVTATMTSDTTAP